MGKSTKFQLIKPLIAIELLLICFAIGLLSGFALYFLKKPSAINPHYRTTACRLIAQTQAAAEKPQVLVESNSDCAENLSPVQAVQSDFHRSDSVSAGLTLLQVARHSDQLRYNVVTSPPFHGDIHTDTNSDTDLDQVIQGVLALLKEQNYPTEPVSISLVDLTGNCCAYAEYQDSQKRYPASIVKLFWLVALYGHYETGLLQPSIDVLTDDEVLMATYSNNGASSRILDAITQTESGDSLEVAALQQWITDRNSINQYFLLSGYPDLNIAHKTFPIPDLGLDERAGRDLQLAQDDNSAIAEAFMHRNFLTTQATARLLYEIDTGQAISPTYSDRVLQHLRHSTDPAVWQSEEPNSIEGFFGEYLSPDVQLYTKLGFTFDDGRQEAAIIASPDGKTRFILVVFANDPVYSGDDVKVFPEIAEYVYQQMRSRLDATTHSASSDSN